MTTTSNHPRADKTSDVIERVEVQCTQLRRAVSVMACARFALNYSDWIEDEWGLDCADVVDVACGLIQEVMTNLDSVNLQPSVARPRSRRVRAPRSRRRTGTRASTAPEAPASDVPERATPEPSG